MGLTRLSAVFHPHLTLSTRRGHLRRQGGGLLVASHVGVDLQVDPHPACYTACSAGLQSRREAKASHYVDSQNSGGEW